MSTVKPKDQVPEDQEPRKEFEVRMRVDAEELKDLVGAGYRPQLGLPELEPSEEALKPVLGCNPKQAEHTPTQLAAKESDASDRSHDCEHGDRAPERAKASLQPPKLLLGRRSRRRS